jgi:hypothetical protein
MLETAVDTLVYWQHPAAILCSGLLFGGMTLFAFGFAASLFTALPLESARLVIRKTFPHFYLWVIIISLCSAALSWQTDEEVSLIFALIGISTIPTRQILMPRINAASDAENFRAFKWLHGASVVITLFHIGASGYCLISLAG